MGSIMTISVYGNNGDEIERTIRSAFDEAKRLEQLMSNYRNDSELSRINRLAPDKPVNCDAELLYVIETSLHYSNLTNGAFDITVSPMVNLWGFFADNDGNINGNRFICESQQCRHIERSVLLRFDKMSPVKSKTKFAKSFGEPSYQLVETRSTKKSVIHSETGLWGISETQTKHEH